MFNLKNTMANKESRFLSGHRMCAGCGVPIIVRMVLRALKNEDRAVIANATGCLEVSTTIYPYTSWKDSYIHTAFGSAPSTISGVYQSYLAQKEKDPNMPETKFLVFAGDGGTYDIGFQSLSATLERGDDFTYICYDNGGYMNTGIQRSSATPQFATTTTTPVGSKEHEGKLEKRKDLTKIIAAHNIPYVAQTAAYKTMKDLYEKSEKAIYTKGATFLNVFSPCPLGWGYSEELLMEINQLAVETCYWPLYEVENGKYKINYKPARKKPIEEFLRPQKRFAHMFEPGNEHMIRQFQEEVDRRWEELLLLEKMTNMSEEEKQEQLQPKVQIPNTPNVQK